MKILSHLLPALILLLSLTHPLAAAEVQVFAAASLTDALQKIAQDYEAKSGDTIRFNFAGSNVLARQIEQGAPADIFFSADEAQMDAVAKKGLLEDKSRRDLLSNTLVVIAPRDGALAKSTQPPCVCCLANPEVKKVALADPKTVPAGVYSKAYLEKVGLWKQLEAKVVPTENVRAALAAVESDNVDAGMVYKTDAAISKGVKIVCEIPRDKGPKIAYPVALIKGCFNVSSAQKFLAYLESKPAREVFAQYGFLVDGK